MSCEDIPSLLDLQNTKKHVDDFGRLMGTGEGDSINEVTGQTRPTYNKVMKSVGFKPGSGDFTTGFTVMPGERDIAWYDPVSLNWYSYLGVIPTGGYPVATGTNPVGSVDWKPVTDELLRNALDSVGGAGLVGDANYAQIRAYTGTSTKINCYGRVNVFDRAHGVFVLDSSDVVSADNDGTILIDALGRRWKRQVIGGAYPEWFGAKCDGVTDDTAALQATFANSKAIILTGNIKVSGTTLIKGGHEIKSEGATISTTSSSLTILYADAVDDWSISGGLTLEKFGFAGVAPTVRVEAHCGIAISGCLNWKLDGIVARGFSGSGFCVTTPTPEFRNAVASSLVSNCISHHNVVGFTHRPGFAAEYVAYTGCISRYNHLHGIEDLAGNIQWTGGQISHNVTIGVSIQSGFNDAHGNMTGAAINHNGGKAIEVVGTNNGFTFAGCSVFDNAVADGSTGGIYFDNCSGVVFTGCQLMADIIEISATGRNLIADCIFAAAPGRLYQHTVLSGGKNVLLRGCVRAGQDNLGVENAFGGSGIRFTRDAAQVIPGAAGDVIFNSPSNAFGQIQYSTSTGIVTIFHTGMYYIDVNLLVQTGATGVFADVYKGATLIGALTATTPSLGENHINGRILFHGVRGDSIRVQVRTNTAGSTVAAYSFIQIALMD